MGRMISRKKRIDWQRRRVERSDHRRTVDKVIVGVHEASAFPPTIPYKNIWITPLETRKWSIPLTLRMTTRMTRMLLLHPQRMRHPPA
jgi:hypothetical protein